MKAKRLLAILLALCLLISAMPMGMLFSASALSGELGPGRITYYNDIRELVTNPACNLNGGKAENLFDGTNEKMEGGWVEGGVIVTFETTRATTITAYTMKTQDDGSWTNRMPKSWNLYGSNDGSEYTLLDSVSNYPTINVNNVFYDDDFRVDNVGAYTYYKLEVTDKAATNSGHFQIAELVLSEFDLSGIIAVENKIEALDENSATFADEVAAARADYDALGDVKASVNNYAKLKAAEDKVAVAGTEDEEKATAAINAIAAIGEPTYKSKAAIEAAEAAWNALSENDKTVLSAYGDTLTAARTQYDELMSNFSITINLSGTGKNNGVPTKWIPNMTADELTATARALEDEYTLWYKNGINLGVTPGKTYNLGIGSWMDISYRVELADMPNDNVAFPMHDRNPNSFVTIPFAGMAFAMDPYVAETWDFPIAIGEPFQYEGNTYQVFATKTMYYPTKEYKNANGDGRSDSGVGATMKRSDNLRPGYTNDDSIKSGIGDGWSFIYAYADWSMQNKASGANIGVPHGNVMKAGDKTYYQDFYGPDGDAYIISTTDMMAAGLALDMSDENITATAVTDALKDSAYVITGELATVMQNAKDTMFAACGDLVSVSDTEIVFENGKVTKDGFTENDDKAAARVQAIIDALPAAADVQASDETAIKAARAEYEAISEAAKALVNTDKLTAAEAALADILAGPAEAVALVKEISEIGTVTYKSRPAIEAARAKYDAMDAETQGYVSNYNVLEAAEAAYQKLIDEFIPSVPSGRPSVNADKMTKNAWLVTCSDDVFNATMADAVDTVKYAYYNGRVLGTANWDDWMTVNNGFWHIKMEGSDDNYNKQDWRGRFTTVVPAFHGMTFSVDTTFAQKYGFENAYALGEYFKMNGKTYQVFWNDFRFYDSVEPNAANDLPDVTRINQHPEERASDADTNKNIFRYAYAKYAQANRWDGLTLGLPASEWAIAIGDSTRAQQYEGPQGYAYLITTADMIAAAPTDASADTYNTEMDKAYVLVNGDLAAAFAANEADIAKYAGDYVSSTESEIVFANGTLTADGFVMDENYVAAKKVIDAIAGLGEITVDSKDAVAAARDAYNALTDEQKAMVGNVDVLNAAMETVKQLILEVDLGINISDGAATAGENGRVNITWNANVVIGENDTIPDINSKLTFTGYGVYYGTGADAVKALANGEETTLAKKMVISEGDDIDVYTVFGFRLTGVAPDRTRAAMFYITFEYEGYSYTVLSDCVEAQATVE